MLLFKVKKPLEGEIPNSFLNEYAGAVVALNPHGINQAVASPKKTQFTTSHHAETI